MEKSEKELKKEEFEKEVKLYARQEIIAFLERVLRDLKKQS